MALLVNRHEGQPTPNVEMNDAHWRDLEKLDTDWIDTGSAELRDGYAWRGIQIHAGDLAIALGTMGSRSRAKLQPVASPPASLRLPPEQPFVSLSHALSWIAFGASMDCDQLRETLEMDRYGEHDPQEAIKVAVSQLLDRARNERVALQGKYRECHRDEKRTLLTAPINPLKLADFRQFNYLSDELRHGEGLTWWRTAQGVTNRLVTGGRSDSFIEVSVERADLMREFPPKVEQSEREHFRCGHTFKRDDPAAIAPWWSVNQSLAWIATRIPSYVEYVGNLETDEPREHRPYIVLAICESQVAESDEGQAFMEARRAGWPAGTFLAHAGRALLGQILAGEVRPMTRENGQGRQMRAEEFAGVGGQEAGSDWLDLTPQPLFSSDEVMNAFPMEVGSSAVEVTSETPAEVPVWLNPYQLVAWVQYRDLQVVAKASDWNGLAAQHMYGDGPNVGSVADVEGALQEGRLIAQGYQKNGDSFTPIPAVEWSRIALAPLDLSRQHPYVRIQFNRRDVRAIFPAIGGEDVAGDQSNAETGAAVTRAPAVKAGRPPSDEEILAKAVEMKARGMDGRTIAKEMRLEQGFQNVATTTVRELIKGLWKPGGRPKKGA